MACQKLPAVSFVAQGVWIWQSKHWLATNRKMPKRLRDYDPLLAYRIYSDLALKRYSLLPDSQRDALSKLSREL